MLVLESLLACQLQVSVVLKDIVMSVGMEVAGGISIQTYHSTGRPIGTSSGMRIPFGMSVRICRMRVPVGMSVGSSFINWRPSGTQIGMGAPIGMSVESSHSIGRPIGNIVGIGLPVGMPFNRSCGTRKPILVPASMEPPVGMLVEC